MLQATQLVSELPLLRGALQLQEEGLRVCAQHGYGNAGSAPLDQTIGSLSGILHLFRKPKFIAELMPTSQG